MRSTSSYTMISRTIQLSVTSACRPIMKANSWPVQNKSLPSSVEDSHIGKRLINKHQGSDCHKEVNEALIRLSKQIQDDIRELLCWDA